MSGAATSLWVQFQALRPSADACAVEAIHCGSGAHHLLVRGERGEPILLLASEPRSSPRADIRLKHVAVQFDRRYEVVNKGVGAPDVANFCKFTCEPGASHLHQYFVELMTATAAAHPGSLSQQSADDVIDALLELFRTLALAADTTVTGLWGELLVMHLAASPGVFVDAWHLRATDGFDFAFSDKRIEVKSTISTARDHDFTLRQVRSGRESDLVASVILTRSSAGLSVLDMARMISDRVNEVQRAKLWRLVLATLGEDALFDEEQRFDLQGASDGLVFVRAVDVPAPDVSEAAAAFVSDVRFRSNINVLCATSFVDRSLVFGSSCTQS